MGIKAVDHFDGRFELAPDSEADLLKLLRSPTFCKQVVKECKLAGNTVLEFAGVLFQPVPWSAATKRGMPQEYEKYLDDPDYTVINVPPNFMFQAKIFNPSRLCAIYRRTAGG
ncbi:hypothetical protein WJX72_009839 [[Myrmecia] bisecta]|uniref:Uncharacterized protein n=1 Tax=[Myrmecia] bisecta TaxID=41462 RepID=A0AAW1PYN5_9CHLO